MVETISIIVPCYNEQDALPLFYHELTNVLAAMNCDYELIMVDDGSGDDTLNVIKRIAEADDNAHYLSFSRNFGKEAAMYAGFQHATGDYTVVMDADMQHPPSLLPEMFEIIQRGDYDSVATRRENRKGENVLRSWFSELFYRVINDSSDVEIQDSATDFRLMSRNMVNAVLAMSERDRFSKGIFSWVGFKTYWLSFPNVERVAGETKWGLRNLFRYAVSGVVNFSHALLNAISWIGLIVTASAFATLVVAVVRILGLHDANPEWLVATCIIVLVCGIQILCLGVIGQYLANVHKEVKQRPQYIIAESDIGSKSKSNRQSKIPAYYTKCS